MPAHTLTHQQNNNFPPLWNTYKVTKAPNYSHISILLMLRSLLIGICWQRKTPSTERGCSWLKPWLGLKPGTWTWFGPLLPTVSYTAPLPGQLADNLYVLRPERLENLLKKHFLQRWNNLHFCTLSQGASHKTPLYYLPLGICQPPNIPLKTSSWKQMLWLRVYSKEEPRLPCYVMWSKLYLLACLSLLGLKPKVLVKTTI